MADNDNVYNDKFLRYVLLIGLILAIAISAFPADNKVIEEVSVELIPTAAKIPDEPDKIEKIEKVSKPNITNVTKTDSLKPSNENVTWRFQFGSYSDEKNAFEMVKSLRSAGYNPKYEKTSNIIRVVLPGVKSSEKQKTEDELKKNGFSNYIVREEKFRP